jgi:hypothetical protein
MVCCVFGRSAAGLKGRGDSFGERWEVGGGR